MNYTSENHLSDRIYINTLLNYVRTYSSKRFDGPRLQRRTHCCEEEEGRTMTASFSDLYPRKLPRPQKTHSQRNCNIIISVEKTRTLIQGPRFIPLYLSESWGISQKLNHHTTR